MADDNSLIKQDRRLAMGEDIGVESIPNPFKQVSNVDKSDGKCCEMSDGQRSAKQKFARYQE